MSVIGCVVPDEHDRKHVSRSQCHERNCTEKFAHCCILEVAVVVPCSFEEECNKLAGRCVGRKSSARMMGKFIDFNRDR